MNRHMKMSLVLVTLMLTFALLLTGCGKTEELQAQIDENATKAENAVKDAEAKAEDAVKDAEAKADAAVKAATADLEAAVKEIKDLISNGDKVNETALAAAVAELEAAIEDAEKLASDADAVTKKALETAIADAVADAADAANEALVEAEAALKEMIDDADDEINNLKSAAYDLLYNVNAIQTNIGKLATKAELGSYATNTALNAVKDSVTNAVNKLNTLDTTVTNALNTITSAMDKMINVDDWDAVTKLVFDELEKLYDAARVYDDIWETYDVDEQYDLNRLYNNAYIKILRATSVNALNGVVEEFVVEAEKLPSICDKINAVLEAIAENGVEYPGDRENLLNAKDLIEDVLNNGADVVKAELVAYGDPAVNLVDVYNDYVDQYEALLQESNGVEIKEAMDAINESLITLDSEDEIIAIVDEYTAWIDVGNVLADVEGFEETYTTFVDVSMTRLEALKNAKTEADDINEDIEEYFEAVKATGATLDNDALKTAVEDKIAAWVGTYFAGDYAFEVADVTVNYAMVDHDVLAAANDAFKASKDAVTLAGQKFIETVTSIGEVDLLSWDEIQIAQRYYDAFVDRAEDYAGVSTFDYLWDADHAPEDYYKTLKTEYAKLVLLQEEAKAAYDAAYAQVVSDATTITIHSTELDDILEWYDMYCHKDGNGDVTFANTTFEGVVFENEIDLNVEGNLNGYQLDKETIIDADDYNAIVELNDVLNMLVEAKLAECEAVEAFIDAIGTVTTDSRSAIEAARSHYDAWKSGSAKPEGFNAAQYAVDDDCTVYVIENVDVLLAAEARLAELDAYAKDIHDAIATYVIHTDIHMNLAAFPNDNGGRVDNATIYFYTIVAIGAMIEDFEVENDGIRGVITDAEMAKLENGVIVAYKVVAYYGEVNTARNEAEISLRNTLQNIAFDDIKADYGKVLTEAQAAIRNANTIDEVTAAMDLAIAKYEGFKSVATVYDTKIPAANGDTVVLKELYLSFSEDTVNKLVAATTIEDINNIVLLCDDLLDAVLEGDYIN